MKLRFAISIGFGRKSFSHIYLFLLEIQMITLNSNRNLLASEAR